MSSTISLYSKKWSEADYRSMPWKNGGGSTKVLAVFPEDADLDEFFWRLSMAQVEQNGAFSEFPRIDRSLAVLTGDGLILHSDSERHSSQTVRLTQESLPHQFSGETPIFAELPGCAVTDLNLMTRRDVCHHFMQRLEGGEHHIAAHNAQQILLYCAQGQAELASNSASAEILQAGDLLLFDEAHEHAGINLMLNAQEDTILYLMRISYVNQ